MFSYKHLRDNSVTETIRRSANVGDQTDADTQTQPIHAEKSRTERLEQRFRGRHRSVAVATALKLARQGLQPRDIAPIIRTDHRQIEGWLFE